VRLPTRFDTDLRLVIPGTSTVFLTGGEEFKGESVTAYEGGYRVLVNPRARLEAAAFVNRYDDLRSQELRFTPSPLTVLGNMLNATTSGVELSATVQAAEGWQVHGSYAWLHKSLSLDAGSTDVTGGVAEGNDPAHLFTLRSNVDLPLRTTFDATLRYVGERPTPVVPAYAELDVRFGWAARAGWELSLVGQNLLHRAHQELTAGGPRQAFRRAVFARSIWTF
jgi:iron complex outermembrane receptor protein